MSRNEENFLTVQDVKIVSMQPLCHGSYVYEGCSKLLSDGRVCALGKHKRKLRRRDPQSPMGPQSRARLSHVCDADGSGKYMFCFAIQIEDFFIQVNEETGKTLMGMSGEEFKAECDGSTDEINKICDKALNAVWTIMYVKDERGQCKAVTILKKLQPRKKSATTAESSVKKDDRDDFSGELVFSLKSF